MAQEAAPAAAEVPKKKSKLLIIIIIAVVALALVGGGAAYFLMKGGDKKAKKADDEEAAADEEASASSHGEKHPPAYLRLETFTVNLSGQDSYLQTEIQLLLSDPKMQEKVNAYMPEVRDRVIKLLSKRTAEELTAPDGDGKDKLAEDLRREVNEILGFKKKSQGVKKVLFVTFIIQ